MSLTARMVMTEKVVTVPRDESLQSAFDKMKHSHFRHLPVVNGAGEVIGMLSERDLERAMSADPLYIQNRLSRVEFDPDAVVEDYMTSKLRAIHADAELQEAAMIMRVERISSLVVVDDDSVMVGIVTSDDLIRVLIDFLSGRISPTGDYKSFAYSGPIGAVADFLSQAGI